MPAVDHQTFCPAAGAREPGIPRSSCLGPKAWSFAQILRFLPCSRPLLDTLAGSNALFRKLEPIFPLNKLSGRTLSIRPFQSPPMTRGLREPSGWPFIICTVYILSNKTSNCKDTSLLKEKGHRI